MSTGPIEGPIIGGPIIGVTTDKADWGVVSFFTVDAEGCNVRFGIERQGYHLALTRPNYNALFSLLLACWVHRDQVQLEYLIPFPTVPRPDPPAPLSIVSIQARPD